MSDPRKNRRARRQSHLQWSTLSSAEQAAGAKLSAHSSKKVTTYLSQHGVPSLGKVFERAQRNLAK